jgi:hypothetical protein
MANIKLLHELSSIILHLKVTTTYDICNIFTVFTYEKVGDELGANFSKYAY